jgi:TetR/AcrR family transcriptional repressor of nem operon
MRYSQTHKDDTHQRLLKIAADVLRKKGPDGLGVAQVMKAAGLTHGGFYAHFKSKDALLAETVGAVFERVAKRWDRMMNGMEPEAALDAYLSHYLSTSHRDNPANGCPVVALNSDLPRQSLSFRRAFDEGVKSMRGNLAARMAAAGIKDATALAPAILASMVGAVALSRTISDTSLSDEVLSSTLREIRQRLNFPNSSLY